MAEYDARTLIDQYPNLVKRNIVNIKKMTLIFVQKMIDIVKSKYHLYSNSNQIMISDCLFSYFKHLLVFSTDPDLVKFVLYAMRNVRNLKIWNLTILDHDFRSRNSEVNRCWQTPRNCKFEILRASEFEGEEEDEEPSEEKKVLANG